MIEYLDTKMGKEQNFQRLKKVTATVVLSVNNDLVKLMWESSWLLVEIMAKKWKKMKAGIGALADGTQVK